jgi:chloramphenicol 3-O phosphotransferase
MSSAVGAGMPSGNNAAVTQAGSPGWVVVLNGPPRSGKSSIVQVIQDTFDGPWMSLGVDVFSQYVTPPRYRPGMGLRPGGERPDLEGLIAAMYRALYDSVAAHSRQGLNVVADVGHHDAYSTPLGVLPDAARRLSGLPALLVGIRCPIEVIMTRRDAGQPGREGRYATSGPVGEVPEPVLRWQRYVHEPGVYDLEVDTSAVTPEAAASMIRDRLEGPAPRAFRQLAADSADRSP